MNEDNVLVQFMKAYGPHTGPDAAVRFAEEVLGITTLDDWQKDVLRDIAGGERRVSISACHGPGKTFIASVAVVWRAVTCFPQHVVVTAPSKGQLEGALVKEVKILFGLLPDTLLDLYEIKKMRIELKSAPEQSYFEARTAREEKPEALQGVHCHGGWVLLIADEASGVHEKIYESAAGSMSGDGATTLLLSNPTKGSGFFFDTHHKLSDMWRTYRISHSDSARVSDDFVEDIRRRYGEDSNAFRIRCLGLFPLSDLDTVIPFDYVDSARKRDLEVPADLAMVWALDVARFGDDDNVFMKRSKLHVDPDIQKWGHTNLMVTAGRVKAAWDDTPPSQRPTDILIDVIGLGAGVVDRLQELGLPARGVNVAEMPSSRDQYMNLRSELWFKARDWLSKKDRKLPECEGGCARDCIHERLAQELVTPTFEYTSSGKRRVESKAEMKKRGFKSPDVADALMLSFAGDPATLLHGSDDGAWSTFGWNTDISRDLPVT